MSFAASRRLSSSKGVFLAVAALAASTACDPFRPAIREHILEGAQYAHYLRFPGRLSDSDSVSTSYRFDHLMFRVSANSPNKLLAAACGYGDDLEESCARAAFEVDALRGFATTAAPPDGWERAKPIPGSDSLRNPSGYLPPFSISRINAAPGTGSDTVGWQFRGKSYSRRNEWITALIPLGSGDGRLLLLAGADRRKLPSRGIFFGDAVADGAYGNVTLDVFVGGPDHKVAAVDLDCGMASLDCMAYVTVVSSRWVAIALDRDLSRAILFDFGEQGSPDTK